MQTRLLSTLILSLLVCVVGVAAQDDLPPADDLTDGLNYLTIEGTTCARGTPYTFAARPGSPEKLLIYFQGGGACWDNFTCRLASTFKQTTEPGEIDDYEGIFDFANPENPLADYSAAVITYCSADVHTGQASAAFGEGADAVQIAYNGAANAHAVLDWVYANYPAPERIVISGSSAGAYGAIYHAPAILQHYPDAQAFVLGDAGLGVIPHGWEGLSTWNMEANLVEGAVLDASDAADFNASLYQLSAEMFPNAAFAEYSAAADQVQIGFYGFMGGAAEAWADGAQSHLEALNTLPNYRSYLAWGDTHTILAFNLFYTMQVNGVRFRDWFAAQANGEVVETVTCAECAAEELYTP
ncbi:MAG: hypothetical protein JNL42_13670 [Anaerolineae bacterium]|nr:hypothetical protein [Anaerolineae bacterium]